MTAEGAEPPRNSATGPGQVSRQHRAKLDEVFGDVLPDATRDDLDADAELGGRGSARSGRDDELRRNVPPHHG
jgi:hypothetical protein